MNRRVHSLGSISNLYQFKQALDLTLNRISDSNTADAGLQEMNTLLKVHGTQGKADRLNSLLEAISETPAKQNLRQKKDILRVLGIASEVYQQHLLVSWWRVCKLISLKICDTDPSTFTVLSEVIGNITHQVFRPSAQRKLYHQTNSQDGTEANKEAQTQLHPLEEEILQKQWMEWMNMFIRFIGTSSSLEPKKSVAGAMCLSISIQNSPEELTQLSRQYLCRSILKPLTRSPNQSTTASTEAIENLLLDCLLSLIISCDRQFRDCCGFTLPTVIEILEKEHSRISNKYSTQQQITTQSWQKRKTCIDIIYSLSVLTPDSLAPFQEQCINLIGQFKYDRIKEVRDAASIAQASLLESSPVEIDSIPPLINIDPPNDNHLSNRNQYKNEDSFNRNLQKQVQSGEGQYQTFHQSEQVPNKFVEIMRGSRLNDEEIQSAMQSLNSWNQSTGVMNQSPPKQTLNRSRSSRQQDPSQKENPSYENNAPSQQRDRSPAYRLSDKRELQSMVQPTPSEFNPRTSNFNFNESKQDQREPKNIEITRLSSIKRKRETEQSPFKDQLKLLSPLRGMKLNMFLDSTGFNPTQEDPFNNNYQDSINLNPPALPFRQGSPDSPQKILQNQNRKNNNQIQDEIVHVNPIFKSQLEDLEKENSQLRALVKYQIQQSQHQKITQQQQQQLEKSKYLDERAIEQSGMIKELWRQLKEEQESKKNMEKLHADTLLKLFSTIKEQNNRIDHLEQKVKANEKLIKQPLTRSVSEHQLKLPTKNRVEESEEMKLQSVTAVEDTFEAPNTKIRSLVPLRPATMRNPIFVNPTSRNLSSTLKARNNSARSPKASPMKESSKFVPNQKPLQTLLLDQYLDTPCLDNQNFQHTRKQNVQTSKHENNSRTSSLSPNNGKIQPSSNINLLSMNDTDKYPKNQRFGGGRKDERVLKIDRQFIQEPENIINENLLKNENNQLKDSKKSQLEDQNYQKLLQQQQQMNQRSKQGYNFDKNSMQTSMSTIPNASAHQISKDDPIKEIEDKMAQQLVGDHQKNLKLAFTSIQVSEIYRFLQNQHYNEALRIALNENDEDLLMQVLQLSDGESCVKQLDQGQFDQLTDRLSSKLNDSEHLNSRLTWLYEILRSDRPISRLHLNSIKFTLNNIMGRQSSNQNANQLSSIEKQKVFYLLKLISVK